MFLAGTPVTKYRITGEKETEVEKCVAHVHTGNTWEVSKSQGVGFEFRLKYHCSPK